MSRTPLSLATAVLIASWGCTWARPVTYALPPGMSASFVPSARAVSTDFAKTFCNVLEAEFGTEWDSCDKYVYMPQAHQAVAPGAFVTDYALLQLGGFGAQCLVNVAETFGDAVTHLRNVHGVQSHHVPLGAFDSSEQNAVRIRDFVASRPPAEKFIVLAHSKGAADVMVALAQFPTQLTRIHAVITVAGAVGGSWLVDRLSGVMGELLRAVGGTACPTQVTALAANAVESMRRANRQEFLASHEAMTTPAFSISAVSTEATTSKILRPLWKRLEPHGWEQDSHIMEREAIVPGGVFLGRALGDHWAVAFPFGSANMTDRAHELVDKNAYPRPALIEAALRTVLPRLP